MRIAVFGLGYVGCVSLGCLAESGHQIIGVDPNQHKVKLINQGRPTIIEDQLDRILKHEFENNRFSATQSHYEAVLDTDIALICVGTPSTPFGHLDLTHIYKVASEIGKSLRDKEDFYTVVIRSTVLPGTNEEVGRIIEKESGKKKNIDFGIVSNPEFLREGSAVMDYYNPALTVVATESDISFSAIQNMYKSIKAPLFRVSIKEAEIIKYVNNSYHALKIVFANEVGNICKRMGIDSRNVMSLFCKDDHLNISEYYFKPGFAYGGSCLPKDLLGLKTLAHDYYLESPVIDSIERSNQNQIDIVKNLINSRNEKKVGILGLSFKAGTDDLRFSPIIDVAEYLLGKGYSIKIFDRNVFVSKLSGTNKDFIMKRIPHLSDLMLEKISDVIRDSDIILINHSFEGLEDIINENQDKYFFDLVGVKDISSNNYEGICW